MTGAWRRIRAALGLGLTWAVAWAVLGVVIGIGVFGFLGFDLLVNTISSGVAGFVGGATFSAVLGVAERNRRFDEMSVARFAVWGAVGGVLVGAAQMAVFLGIGSAPNVLVFGLLEALLGAGSAAGTLLVARAADDAELLEEGERVAEVGLTEEERRALLG